MQLLLQVVYQPFVTMATRFKISAMTYCESRCVRYAAAAWLMNIHRKGRSATLAKLSAVCRFEARADVAKMAVSCANCSYKLRSSAMKDVEVTDRDA